MAIKEKHFGSDHYRIVYTVEPAQDGMRLDQFILTHFLSFSREFAKKRITEGAVRILKRPHPHKPSTKVYQDEEVEIITEVTTHEDEYWQGELINKEEAQILYHDDDLVAISKPAFMTTHPTGKHLFYCATVVISEKFKQLARSVHRLDRETSGCLILALNNKTANIVTSAFESRQVKKCYFFISHKNKSATPLPFTAIERLGQQEDFIPKMYMHCYESNSKQGKSASTHFELISDLGDYIIGLAFPKTGRQHQIRAHAAHHGYPLLGDKLYNGDPEIFRRFKDQLPSKVDYQKMQLPRHALHSMAIELPKALKIKKNFFFAPIAVDLNQWLYTIFKDKINIKKVNQQCIEIIQKNFNIQ
jgi:RluA family pseudouridine synthase